MNKVISTLCLFFISFNFLGQDSGSFFGSNQMLSGGSFASSNNNINSGYSNVKGSPYLFDDFKNSGVLELVTGEKYNIKNININLDKVQFVSEQGKDSIFIFRNVKKVIIQYKEYSQIENNIYQLLEVGNNISFLKKEEKVIKRQVQDKLTPEIVKWKLIEDYYLKVDGGLILINLRKKDFFNYLDKSKLTELKKYIKSEKLSVKKEKDLIKILHYYNSI